MSANEPRLETQPADTTETVAETLPTKNTATTESTPAKPWSMQKMSAEELTQLERDMQLKDPAEVVLPGGKTLKEVQDARRATEITTAREVAEKSENEPPPLPAHSSTVMTTESVVAVSETGQIVTVPLTPPPTDEQNQPQG